MFRFWTASFLRTQKERTNTGAKVAVWYKADRPVNQSEGIAIKDQIWTKSAAPLHQSTSSKLIKPTKTRRSREEQTRKHRDLHHQLAPSKQPRVLNVHIRNCNRGFKGQHLRSTLL